MAKQIMMICLCLTFFLAVCGEMPGDAAILRKLSYVEMIGPGAQGSDVIGRKATPIPKLATPPESQNPLNEHAKERFDKVKALLQDEKLKTENLNVLRDHLKALGIRPATISKIFDGFTGLEGYVKKEPPVEYEGALKHLIDYLLLDLKLELMDLRADLRRYREGAQQDIAQKINEIIQPILKILSSAVLIADGISITVGATPAPRAEPVFPPAAPAQLMSAI